VLAESSRRKTPMSTLAKRLVAEPLNYASRIASGSTLAGHYPCV
jgi:hypothetical protein